MPIILERYSTNLDPSFEFEFPDIEINNASILLIYEASRELHDNGLMDYIIEFLDKKNAFEFEKFVNSSLYFKMPGGRSKKALRLLNSEFKKHMTPFEQLHGGKIRWVFNYITLFEKDTTHHTIAMIGRGNQTLYQHFADKIKLFIQHLRARPQQNP